MSKTASGNFFEDFRLGQVIQHATPRTVTVGDVALYTALYGPRFAVQSSDAFARALGYPRAPVDDLLVFHVVFGKTVPDISLNAVANLGYADCRFLKPVYPGDTLTADLGGDRAQGEFQPQDRHRLCALARAQPARQDVLEYVRWVMVRKRDEAAAAPGDAGAARCPRRSRRSALGGACPILDIGAYDPALAGSAHAALRLQAGRADRPCRRHDGRGGRAPLATRLYQNTARVHFNQFTEAQGRFGKRLIYGGHVISLARALSFNGLGNAFHIAAINGGRHVAPLFAGGTVFCWSQVLERAELPGRSDVGALRLRTVATKDRPCADFPDKSGKDYDPAVILDLDYWVLLPR